MQDFFRAKLNSKRMYKDLKKTRLNVIGYIWWLRRGYMLWVIGNNINNDVECDGLDTLLEVLCSG